MIEIDDEGAVSPIDRVAEAERRLAAAEALANTSAKEVLAAMADLELAVGVLLDEGQVWQGAVMYLNNIHDMAAVEPRRILLVDIPRGVDARWRQGDATLQMDIEPGDLTCHGGGLPELVDWATSRGITIDRGSIEARIRQLRQEEIAASEESVARALRTGFLSRLLADGAPLGVR